MKELLYVSFVDFADAQQWGVTKKILTQIKVFEAAGFHATCITLQGNSIVRMCGEETICMRECKQGVRARIALLDSFKKYLKDNSVDICYIRYQFSDPFFVSALRKLSAKGVRIIIEIATYPYEPALRMQGVGGRIKICCDQMFRGYMKKSVERFVTYSKDERILGVKAIQVINGLDLKMNPLRKPHEPDECLVLLTVSSMKPWHGYDRLLKGMRNYYKDGGTRVILLYMVGDGPACAEYRTLVNEYHLSEKVVYCGFLQDKALDEMYEKSDIAISSLADHRAGVYTASPLKTAEYAVRGIPFVTAYDVEGMEQGKHYMRVPPDDTPIDIFKIVAFINKINEVGKNSAEIAQEIHNAAIDCYGMEKTHIPVLQHLIS